MHRPFALLLCFSLAILASAHIFDHRHLLKQRSVYADTHQLEKRQGETVCRNDSCSFLDSASTCITQDCICSALSEAGNDTVETCESCIRPFDSFVADSLVANAAQCSILNMTTTPTPTSPPPTDCNQPCSAITEAFSTCIGTNVSCWCSPIFASGVQCGKCLASLNATRTADIISIDIPSCFRLANPEPISTNNILGDCFDSQGPCAPLIEATALKPGATTRCVAGACLCPGALSAGTACLQCIATLNPTVASEFDNFGEIMTSCQESPSATSAYMRPLERAAVTPSPLKPPSGLWGPHHLPPYLCRRLHEAVLGTSCSKRCFILDCFS